LCNLDLRNISLLGCAAWDEPVFANLAAYIERDEIKPILAKTFGLGQIVQAQIEFLKKDPVGKFALIAPVAAAVASVADQ